MGSTVLSKTGKYRTRQVSRMFEDLIEQYKTKRTSHLQRQHGELYVYLVNTTEFLPLDVSTTRRLWHHWNDVFYIPSCQMCENVVSWDVAKQQYRKYCSVECTPKPLKQTKKQLYSCTACGVKFAGGGTTPTCSKLCTDKLRSLPALPLDIVVDQLRTLKFANLKQFAKREALLHASVINHTKHLGKNVSTQMRIQFLLDPHNSEAAKQLDLKMRLQETGIKTKGELNTRARYTNNICPLCKTNERPYNTSSRKLSRWCSECTSRREEQKLRPKQARPSAWNKNIDVRLNDPEWLYTQHHVEEKTKQQIAAELGVDKETVSNRFEQFQIQSIKHRYKTKQQNELVEYLKQLGVTDVIENERTLVAPKQIDIYIPSKKLAIEYCGLYWHSTAQSRITPSYHKHKYDACKRKGVRLLTIFSDEWLDQKELCKLKIASILGIADQATVFARKCLIASVPSGDKRGFFEQHHIQGDGPSSVNYGLYDPKGELVACMGFIVSASGIATLNRYATSCSVPGGFSRLLRHSIRLNPHWSRIVSFADLRWSEGSVYASNGFALEAVISPEYHYTKGNERIHKFNFRHKHLKRVLGESVYDPLKSETENTRAAGWFKIYDCGKQRWVLTP